MGTDYRLTCASWKDYRTTTTTCVFDAAAGEKSCAGTLDVEVLNRNGERWARFKTGRGRYHEAPLPKYSHESDRARFSEGRLDDPHSTCWLGMIPADEGARLTAIRAGNPRSWALIAPYLDHERYPEQYTIRNRALQVLGPNSNDRYYPTLLTDVAHAICGERGEDLPTLSTDLPETTGLWHIPTELRTCTESQFIYGPVATTHQRPVTDRQCFWNMLTTYVPRTPFAPKGNPIRVIDVACGDADGAQPLVEYFQQYLGLELPYLGRVDWTVDYTGVDLSKEDLQQARANHPGHFQFVEADAIDFLAEPTREYDVILLRHPGPIKDDWGDASAMWAEMMQKAYARLAQGGLLIVTTFYCYEHFFARALFEEQLDASVYVAGKNPFSHHQGVMHRDPFLLMVGKQPRYDVPAALRNLVADLRPVVEVITMGARIFIQLVTVGGQ